MFVHVLKIKPVVEWLPKCLNWISFALWRMDIWTIFWKAFSRWKCTMVWCILVIRTSTFSSHVFRISCGCTMIMWNSKNMDFKWRYTHNHTSFQPQCEPDMNKSYVRTHNMTMMLFSRQTFKWSQQQYAQDNSEGRKKKSVEDFKANGTNKLNRKKL